MGFSPISLPSFQPGDPTAGANILMQGAKLRQQQQQQAAENLFNQQRLGIEQTRTEAENRRADAASRREDRMIDAQMRAQRLQSAQSILPYLDPGSQQFNPQMATTMAGVAGVGLQQAPDNTQPPGPAPAEPQAPAFNGPIPSQQDARAAAQQQAGQQLSPQDGPVLPRMREAGDAAAQEALQQQAERDQYAQQLAEMPARQAKYAQEQKDFQLRKQFPAFQMDMGDGQPMTVDTLAMHRQAEAARQLRVQKYQEAYADDPEAAKIVVPMAALGVADKDISAHLTNLQGKRESLDNKWALANQFQTTADQKYQIGMANARAHAMSAQAGVGAKQDAAAARAQSLLGQAMGRAEKEVDWKGLVGMDNTMRSLMSNIDSPNVLQSRDAQIQLGRIFRGTTPTEGEMHLLYNNLGGTADKWNQFVAGLESGGLSAEQKRQLKASAETARGELEHRKERAFGALKTAFGPGSGYEVMGPQINAALKSHGQAIGVDVPDLYDTAQAGPGAVVLGSRAGKQKSNPLVDAAKKNARDKKIQSMPADDKAAVDWATKNPQDPRAARILQLHGL